MIYELPKDDAPIRQEDIFVSIPRIDIDLQKMVVYNERDNTEMKWIELSKNSNSSNIVVPVRPVTAIVATQDCDASRSPDITLCEIRNFREVEPKSKDTKTPKKWISILTQHARINQKWFYLPPAPDSALGFTDKMGVDFHITIRMPRTDLENLRSSLRRGRLNEIANKHFRERISEFFRRYPYNEWYPLDTQEMEEYKKEYPDIELYPWQKGAVP